MGNYIERPSVIRDAVERPSIIRDVIDCGGGVAITVEDSNVESGAWSNLDYLYFLLYPIDLKMNANPRLIYYSQVDLNASNTKKQLDSQLFQ